MFDRCEKTVYADYEINGHKDPVYLDIRNRLLDWAEDNFKEVHDITLEHNKYIQDGDGNLYLFHNDAFCDKDGMIVSAVNIKFKALPRESK